MRRLRAVLNRAAGWFGGTQREREWTAEFEEHFRLHFEDNLRAGLSPDEARREALVKFGSIESVKESMRDGATFTWLDSTLRDIRYALRSLRRSPSFTVTAILSLALGLGASMAVFTVADNLLIRPLPYHDSSQLFMLWGTNTKRGGDRGEVSARNYFEWKAGNDVLDDLGALRASASVLVAGNQAEEFGKQSVTAGFFPLLGVQPVRGRFFTSEEDLPGGSHDALLISYRLWQRWFGGEENVIGRKVQVDSVPRTIVGVLPPSFYFFDREIDLWEPLGLNANGNDRDTLARSLLCVGRIKSGVSINQLQSHMTALAGRLEAAHPEVNKDITIQIEPLRDAMFSEVKTSLLVLLGAVAMMLAVASANVANLLLARYSTRRRELAVRASIGASRGRVIRQLLTESVLLSLAGGICGVMLARWVVRGLLLLAPANLTHSVEIHFDSRIFVFAIALSLLTGILFGLAPALVTSRLDLISSLRGDSPSTLGAGGRLRGWLVGAQVAISVVLLAAAMLLSRSLMGLQAVNPGLNPANLLTFRISLPQARYQEIPSRIQYFRRAIQHIEQLPGVRSVSAVSHPPFRGHGTGTYVNIQGHPPAKLGQELLALVRSVMPGYFHTLGIPLKSGRDFIESDNVETSLHRCIVNEAFVRQFLRGEQPLGKKINLWLLEPGGSFSEIVGVVGDLREWAIDREPMPTVYYPYSQLSRSSMILLVRTERNPMSLASPARRIIRQLDAEQPIAGIRTMEEILGENYSRQRFSAWLLSGFAAVALVLAGIGIYGILAYAVTARTRELGVRAALGADSARIIALVLNAGARPVLAGLVIGVAGALGFAGLLKSLLFGIGPRDPVTFVVVPSLLAAVALIAACLPAHRAVCLDPIEALRTE